MRFFRVFLFAGLALSLSAQDLSKLPPWAGAAAREVDGKPLPDADAWMVLDRTEMAYTGDGEIRVRKLRLVRVITERGLSEARYALGGLGGKASKIHRLRGWNLRPDNELVKLDEDHVATGDLSNAHSVSSDTLTIAVLPRAMKGSWIAFESQETFRHPTGPTGRTFVMGEHPIHRWELNLAKGEGWFTNLKGVAVHLEARNFQPWTRDVALVAGESVQVLNVPALPKNEAACPDETEALPWVLYRFQDPELKEAPSSRSWDTVAQWVCATFRTKFSAQSETGVGGLPPEKGLPALHQWMSREMTYRQVYLTPERSWVPERVPETFRKRYGDCKDLAACFISEASSMGLQAYPVLANIGGRGASAGDPPHFAFDHAIAAVRLDKSLGLPSEVETPKGRFLLVDPTSRFTPLGRLPESHRGGELLICTESDGLWVRVPASAVHLPKARVLLEGKVSGQGALEMTLRYLEEGDALGLRSACLALGPQKMRDWILNNRLDLPPTGSLEIVELGNPLEGDKPFVVLLKILHPEGFHLQGGEGILADCGLPTSPNPIQKPGAPRHFPVQFRSATTLEYEANILLPWRVTPALPDKKLESPFRAAAWSAEAIPEGRGSRLRLTFSQQRRDAFFGFPERERGVAEWKKDRSAFRNLLNDGLAFKLTH